MTEKEVKGIVLNRMYTGSYLSTNLGHEVINMFQADDGKHYLYLNAKGNFSSIGKEVTTMLLVRHVGENCVEVVGMAKNLKCVDSACCSLPRDLGRINETIQEAQQKFMKGIKYNRVPIQEIFGVSGQQNVFISYWVKKEDFYTPKDGESIIIRFKDNKDKNSSRAKFPLIDSIASVDLKEHNFSSTSLHQFILDGEDLDLLNNDICNKDIWEQKDNIVTIPEDFSPCRISLFDICQIQNDENCFSNALSFFMNKYPKLWSTFWEEKIRDDIKLEPIQSITREENAKIDGKKDTGGRIDLLIRTKNYYIIVENKIDSRVIIDEKEKLSQLERYYNYVSYLQEEEKVRLKKEEEELANKIKERQSQIENLLNKGGKRYEFWTEDIEKLRKKDTEVKQRLKEVETRKIEGFVLAPDYNMPSEEECIIKERNYEFIKIRYSEVCIWLEANAEEELDCDLDFNAFYIAMKRHSYSPKSKSLYEDMKNTFFTRIKDLKK